MLLQQTRQALLDRHVAWEQGQRVGIAGLLDLQFGNQFEYVYHAAQPKIAAIEGDDEIFFDALAGTACDQATDLLQRLTQLDGEEVIVHQATDGFAGEQIGGKGLEQGIGERMPMDDTARLTLCIQDRQRVQVGLAAKGFEHRGGRGVPVHGGLLVEQCAEVAAVFAQYNAGAVLAGHHCPGIPWRVFLGATEQIALDQIDAHLGQYRELFR
ncbi:hypothetical protein D3C78_1179320 [compost metagenome]